MKFNELQDSYFVNGINHGMIKKAFRCIEIHKLGWEETKMLENIHKKCIVRILNNQHGIFAAKYKKLDNLDRRI